MKNTKKNVNLSETKLGNEFYYQTFFHNSKSINLLINPGNGSIVDANPAACNFYGYNKSSLCSMTIYDINQSSKEDIFKLMDNAKEEMNNHFFFQHKIKNGEIKEVEVYSGPVIINSNEYLYSLIHDITKQKQTESELKKSLGVWNTTFNSMHDSVGIIDLNNKFTTFNKSSEKMFNKSSKEISRLHCYELIHGLKDPVEECPFKRMKKSKQSEYMIFEREGKWLRVNVDPIFDNEGKVVSAVHVVSDITQKYISEQDLEDSKKILQLTQHLTKVGGWKYIIAKQQMVWTDETYRIHDMDIPESKDILDNKIELGLNCYDEKDRPIITEAFNKCRDKGITYDLIFPFTTVKGRRIWIRTTAEAIRVNGKIVSIIGNIMDITRKKEIENKLEEYKNHLEDLVKQRTTELETKNKELEHFNQLFVDREFRIKELRDRVEELEGKGR